MRGVKNFRELNVYIRALGNARDIYQETKAWPAFERFGLVSQIRRSSRAVAGLIAEAWARRRYSGAFINTLSQALGEATETQAWLDLARDCEYVSEQNYEAMNAEWQIIGAMIQRMIDREDQFAPLKSPRSIH